MDTLYDFVKKGSDITSYSWAVNKLTKQKRSLYTAFFQLTPLCNLDCKMCYARLDPRDISRRGKYILGFEHWKWYIDEAVKEGLILLSITGGECTLHPDFCKIYSYAYDRGIQIVVMTNAAYITEQIFALWQSKPPTSISITIYGSSSDTYEKLCGDGNAFDKVYQNIMLLDAAGLNLHLKFTAVRDNIHDMLSVDRFCRRIGHILYCTHTLIKYERCTSNVLNNEVADQKAFADIMKKIHSERAGIFTNDKKQIEVEKPENSCDLEAIGLRAEKGITCSAARNSCYIDWEGMMTPCVAFDALRLNPALKGFHECWKEMSKWADGIPVLEECVSCIHKYKCNRCIALHYNDTGAFNKVSPRLCWKRQHPGEAEDIEKQLVVKGLIPSVEVDHFKG